MAMEDLRRRRGGGRSASPTGIGRWWSLIMTNCILLLILLCFNLTSTTAMNTAVADGTQASYGFESKFFYIYDWPDYIYDVWPPLDAPLHLNASYSHKFRGHNGAGQEVHRDFGYFNTWQFAMYQLTMARLRVSPMRTLDPSKATSFIIPFDVGVHSFIDHNNGRVRVASPHGWRVSEWLKETIQKFYDQGIWKHRGHDHFVLFSITSYQIIGIGAKVFLTQICQNCTVLTIETTPTLTSRKYYSNKSRKWWYAVPYPSSFHWHEGIKTLPWKQASPAIASDIETHRPYLAIFIGSVDTSTPRSNVVRRVLRRDCVQPKGCLWFDTQHACSGVLNQTDAMLLYRKTRFCLTPTGDSLTRKSLFDSLVAGCIPVIFAKATVTQYLWHIPPEVVEQVTIYIPAQELIDEKISFLNILQNISSSQILQMQQKIEELAPTLQYSIVPDGYGATEEEALRYYQLSRFGYRSAVVANPKKRQKASSTAVAVPPDLYPLPDADYKYKGKHWNPPFRDAVDVIMERILNRTTIEPLEGFTHDQVLQFAQLRDDISAEDPDYTGLVRIKQVLQSKEARAWQKANGLVSEGYLRPADVKAWKAKKKRGNKEGNLKSIT